jgi:hypothetical protein
MTAMQSRASKRPSLAEAFRGRLTAETFFNIRPKRCILSPMIAIKASPILIVTTTTLLLAPSNHAQSLSGSPASMDRQAQQARIHDFTYIEDAQRVRRFVDGGLLVHVEGSGDYDLHDVSYPYARPAVKLFVERLAGQFHSACGEVLTVTSLTRPRSEQPANAHDQSVHPTGMAIDLRMPGTPRCRDWLNRVLLSLEGTGVLEATRERNPAHYHVAIYPEIYESYVRSLRADVREYVVQRGDALFSIARTNGTTVSALSSANGLESDRILPGQVLRLPD